MSVDSEDEMGRMAETLNQTVETVEHSLEEVRAAAEREKYQADEQQIKVDQMLEVLNAVAEASDGTSRGAANVLDTSNDLAKMANKLQSLVGQYKI